MARVRSDDLCFMIAVPILVFVLSQTVQATAPDHILGFWVTRLKLLRVPAWVKLLREDQPFGSTDKNPPAQRESSSLTTTSPGRGHRRL